MNDASYHLCEVGVVPIWHLGLEKAVFQKENKLQTVFCTLQYNQMFDLSFTTYYVE